MAKLSDTDIFKLRESYNQHLKETDGILTAEGLHKIYLECGQDFPLQKIKTLAKPMRILSKPSFLEAKMLFMQLKMFANKAPSGVLSPRGGEEAAAAPQVRCWLISSCSPPLDPHVPYASTCVEFCFFFDLLSFSYLFISLFVLLFSSSVNAFPKSFVVVLFFLEISFI